MKAAALRLVRNPRLVVKLAPKRWPSNLPPPVMVADTEAKMRAVSLLRGMATRDGEPVHACDLTPAQARDVVASFPSPSTPSPAASLPAGADGLSFSQESP